MSDTIGHPDPALDLSDGFKPHTSHWGVFSARLGEAGLEVRPYAGDPDPNRIIDNFPGALRHQARIAQPAIRRGWLERGPGAPTIAAAAMSLFPSAGRRRSICSAAS
jgi:biotin/methionine sulfoxide reductase